MFLININCDNCIKIIFILLIGLVGYVILAIGFIAISLQKTFQSYNLKFDHLKELILDINEKEFKEDINKEFKEDINKEFNKEFKEDINKEKE